MVQTCDSQTGIVGGGTVPESQKQHEHEDASSLPSSQPTPHPKPAAPRPRASSSKDHDNNKILVKNVAKMSERFSRCNVTVARLGIISNVPRFLKVNMNFSEASFFTLI